VVNAIQKYKETHGDTIDFQLRRVPFFLEPNYLSKPGTFTEPHNTRMVRKFGSMEAFERVKKSHGLIPRGKEVGLDEKVGFHQPQLDKRIQSSTMKSHRLILYVAQTFGLESCEALYDEINRRHFTEAAVLNDNNVLMAAVSVALNISKEQQLAALSFLNDEQQGYNTVLQMYERVQNLGVYSIPTLIVDGGYMLSGAQRSDQIYDILVQAIQNGITSKRLFGDFSVLENEKE
jgi:predicted DsbA family dithiol-disulfide isomerase